METPFPPLCHLLVDLVLDGRAPTAVVCVRGGVVPGTVQVRRREGDRRQARWPRGATCRLLARRAGAGLTEEGGNLGDDVGVLKPLAVSGHPLTVVTVAGSWFDSGFITAADVVGRKLGEHVPGCASCFAGVQGCGDGEDAVALADVTGADVFSADGLRESRSAVAVVVGAGR